MDLGVGVGEEMMPVFLWIPFGCWVAMVRGLLYAVASRTVIGLVDQPYLQFLLLSQTVP